MTIAFYFSKDIDRFEMAHRDCSSDVQQISISSYSMRPYVTV